jgi:hypothetical protein
MIALTSCVKTIKKENKTIKVAPKTSDGNGEMYLGGEIYNISPELQEKFLKEGFITQAKFRITIVTIRGTNIPLEEIEEKAKKRAFITLQKFVTSEGIQISKNMQAELLNLISTNGILSKQTIEECTDDIYYFDIDRENLKRHIKSLAEK